VALTRDFKETIQARARRDPAFRRELLREAVESFLSGDVETGKMVLRDYINATVGFNQLAGRTHRSPKSLMRMLGPSGNPQARSLFEIVDYLQRQEKVRFRVHAAAAR
jgi:DNA-binding phage protein